MPCYFCQKNIKKVDYKDTETLRKFLSFHNKILPSKVTKLCIKHQKEAARSIKRARQAALLPFVGEE